MGKTGMELATEYRKQHRKFIKHQFKVNPNLVVIVNGRKITSFKEYKELEHGWTRQT